MGFMPTDIVFASDRLYFEQDGTAYLITNRHNVAEEIPRAPASLRTLRCRTRSPLLSTVEAHLSVATSESCSCIVISPPRTNAWYEHPTFGHCWISLRSPFPAIIRATFGSCRSMRSRSPAASRGGSRRLFIVGYPFPISRYASRPT